MAPLTASFRILWRFYHHRKQHFKTATTGVATKNMRNELNRLVNTVSDPNTKKVCLRSSLKAHRLTAARQAFDTEMQSFFYLFTRYLAEKAESKEL